MMINKTAIKVRSDMMFLTQEMEHYINNWRSAMSDCKALQYDIEQRKAILIGEAYRNGTINGANEQQRRAQTDLVLAQDTDLYKLMNDLATLTARSNSYRMLVETELKRIQLMSAMYSSGEYFLSREEERGGEDAEEIY